MDLHKIFAASVVSVYVMLAGGCHNVMYTASQGLSGLSAAAEAESRKLASSGLQETAAGQEYRAQPAGQTSGTASSPISVWGTARGRRSSITRTS